MIESLLDTDFRRMGTDTPPRRFAAADAVILLLIGVGTALSLPLFHSIRPVRVLVYGENRLVASYPLDTDRQFQVSCARGPVTITIENRKVFISKSSCPHGICMKSGKISRPNAQIVCAPNRLLVTIADSSPDSVDAISR